MMPRGRRRKMPGCLAVGTAPSVFEGRRREDAAGLVAGGERVSAGRARKAPPARRGFCRPARLRMLFVHKRSTFYFRRAVQFVLYGSLSNAEDEHCSVLGIVLAIGIIRQCRGQVGRARLLPICTA